MNRQEMNKHNAAIKGAKVALANAAMVGINEHLRTTRGAYDFGAHAKAELTLDNARVVQIACSVTGVPTLFEVTVREVHGSNK